MIIIERLSEENFSENALDSYIRTHEVKKVYRKQGEEYVLVECPYTEDWNLEKNVKWLGILVVKIISLTLHWMRIG